MNYAGLALIIAHRMQTDREREMKRRDRRRFGR